MIAKCIRVLRMDKLKQVLGIQDKNGIKAS